MAVECSQEAILNFLRDRGGRVPNTELVEHFKPIFPSDPKRKAAARELFKSHVDSVARVKTRRGVKCVCLKKKLSLKQGAQTGSDYTRAEVPHVLEPLPDAEPARSAMGNRGSVKREKRESRRDGAAEIPVITVIQPSPLPVQEPAFDLPQLEPSAGAEQGEARVATPEDAREQPRHDRRGSEGSVRSLTGSEGTPSISRKHFIQAMMCASPEVRRTVHLRRSSLSRSNSDSVSTASGNLEEDRNSVALDPLEHEWMLCASDADWGSLLKLLHSDPGLVLKRDFVTGFTCLHWAAKRGNPELIALIVNFSKQNGVPVSVDVRSSTGYTPLHVAAMHNHMDVVKLLVGAYDADVEMRDYSGRKACQYLTDRASVDIQDIIGAYEVETERNPAAAAGEKWRFSKVFETQPPRRLNSTGDCDSPERGAREQPLGRRSSLGRMKPTLQNLRWRTSQLMHSTTFHGTRDLEKRKGSRPKTHFFT